MQNPGIVVCSRLDSERIPGKVLRKLNGIPIIVHLLRQLVKAGPKVFVAVPLDQTPKYLEVIRQFDELDGVVVVGSDFEKDPLARTYQVCQSFRLSHVFRVTHDKIFVDIESMQAILGNKICASVEYVYSSDFTPGTGFEVLSAKCLEKATNKFKDVEHITYAARLVADSTLDYRTGHSLSRLQFQGNLLIDFPEDLKLMEVVLSRLGNESSLNEVVSYLIANPKIASINRQPLVSIYTCAFNAEKYLNQTIDSVLEISVFANSEYILVDDHSSDRTCEIMAERAFNNPNISWYRNEKNIGLASSSNFALRRARGKYIIRLDADDYFDNFHGVRDMVRQAERAGQEIVYPDNWFGSWDKVQKGKEKHHVGGALFDRKALNFIRFTDNLRHYEGLDLFVRARDQLKIGYFEKPVFFYRQHDESMSKNNLELRDQIKAEILGDHESEV